MFTTWILINMLASIAIIIAIVKIILSSYGLIAIMLMALLWGIFAK